VALNPLLDALGADAERDIRDIAAAAAAEAAQIRAAARARVAQRSELALATCRKELDAERDAQRAAVLRESRQAILAARDAFLERVFEAAEAELRGTLLTTRGAASVVGLVREALPYLPPAPIVRCRSDLVEPLQRAIASLGPARLLRDDTLGEGVIVQAEDGSVLIDNTLENRLRWLRPVLSIELLARVANPV
jgi:vacuolar-type H+-ATPase subunit E/Vma4